MDIHGSGQCLVLSCGFDPTGILGFPKGCQGDDSRRCLKPTAGAWAGCHEKVGMRLGVGTLGTQGCTST